MAAEIMAAPEPGFGIYIHWPFCLAKCPYCDFNSHVRDSIDHGHWQRALLKDLEYFAEITPGRIVSSIFFGGGTPSLMPPDLVAAMIAAVRRAWSTAPDMEITLEANPTSVEAARFRGFCDAGVNRLSLGVQALDNAALKFLGRGHSVEEAMRALELARTHFPRISFDLIYARPDQTAPQWQDELARALQLSPEHLSLYTLTIEQNTGFAGQVARGAWAPMPADDQAALFDLTQELCEQAGMPAYEISNHAKSGAASRHNLTYWRYGDYAGVGPGAHSRIGRDGQKLAFAAERKPEVWLEQVQVQGHGAGSATLIDDVAGAQEALLMGLRLTEGIYFENFRKTVGFEMDEVLPPSRLDRMIAGGFLQREPSRLLATAKGRLVLDSVLAELLADAV
jgi:oxygen-independent coproporphyrinogen-3 oxidase